MYIVSLKTSCTEKRKNGGRWRARVKFIHHQRGSPSTVLGWDENIKRFASGARPNSILTDKDRNRFKLLPYYRCTLGVTECAINTHPIPCGFSSRERIGHDSWYTSRVLRLYDNDHRLESSEIDSRKSLRSVMWRFSRAESGNDKTLGAQITIILLLKFLFYYVTHLATFCHTNSSQSGESHA